VDFRKLGLKSLKALRASENLVGNGDVNGTWKIIR
jgi:hypothetical protein